MAALPTMLAEDRKRAGWSVGQAAWRLGESSASTGSSSPALAPGFRDVGPDLLRLAAVVRVVTSPIR